MSQVSPHRIAGASLPESVRPSFYARWPEVGRLLATDGDPGSGRRSCDCFPRRPDSTAAGVAVRSPFPSAPAPPGVALISVDLRRERGSFMKLSLVVLTPGK